VWAIPAVSNPNLDRNRFAQQLGTYIPSTAAFFLSYVSYRTLTLLPMELCQLLPLFRLAAGDVLRCCCLRPAENSEPPPVKALPFRCGSLHAEQAERARAAAEEAAAAAEAEVERGGTCVDEEPLPLTVETDGA
jgi:hypothetical protein